MSSNITLSAGVRQNLLSLQDTAALAALTQNRLATGKKVNSALDNPSNFFTSQSLSDRATSLNSLLDSIGQATKTLDAASNGITSLRTLVQSAKSIAQQARQTTGAVNTYSAVDASSSILSATNLNGAETVATATGTSRNLEATAIAISGKTVTETLGQVQADNAHAINPVAIDLSFTAQAETKGNFTSTIDLANDTPAGVDTHTVSFVVSDRGNNYTLTTAALADGDNLSQLIGKLNAATDGSGHTLSQFYTLTGAGGGGTNRIQFDAISASSDLSVTASADTALLGLTVDGSTNRSVLSQSLLDNIGGNATLALDVNGTGSQTVTFDSSHVVTLADLNTQLSSVVTGLAGGSGVSGNTVSIKDAAGASNSLVLTAGGATPAGLKTALGLGTAAGAVDLTNGTGRGGLGAGNTRTYNSDPTVAELDPTNLGSGGSIVIALDKNDGNGSSNRTVNLAATDKLSAVITALQGDAQINANITVASVSGKLTLTSKFADTDFVVQGSAASAVFGLTSSSSTTSGNAGKSNSLFDQLSTAGSAQGKTVVISGAGATGTAFTTQTITIGTGGSEVSTLSELNTALGTAATNSGGGFSAAATPTTTGLNITGAISITKPAGTKSSVTIGGDLSTLTAASSVFETAAGDVFGTHNSQPTVADLGKSLGGGAGGPVDLSAGGSLSFSVNSQNFTVGVAATDRVDDVVSKLASSSLAASLTFTKVSDGSGHDHIKVDAKDSSVDFTVNANDASAALGLTTTKTASSTNDSTSLLDLLDTSFGGVGNGSGKTLTVVANGGNTQTVTFGKNTGQVQTIAQLNTSLAALAGVTASVTNAGSLDINIASGSTATSLTIGGTAAGKLGLTAGTQTGTVISSTDNTTRASLQNDFNNVLGQIDALSKDSSYNGINLLNGDDLKVIFNESGSSSLTITGVTYNAANLGLTKATGSQFQDNTSIDTTLAATDNALTSLRTQASKFGSNLSTVQTRQDFTKSMINTLQTGSDALVLADTNEEGANLLALQTRQQLSSTALSLANQANQAVLRLF